MTDEVNQVDVSDATIDAEWSRIANDHDVDLSAGAGGLNFDGVEGVSVEGSVASGVSLQAVEDVMAGKVKTAKMVIRSALTFVFEGIFALKLRVHNTMIFLRCGRCTLLISTKAEFLSF